AGRPGRGTDRWRRAGHSRPRHQEPEQAGRHGESEHGHGGGARRTARRRRENGGADHRVPAEEGSLQEARGAHERAGRGREELSQAEIADHGRRQGGTGAAKLDTDLTDEPLMHRHDGYSLVELIVVTMILATLTALATPRLLA